MLAGILSLLSGLSGLLTPFAPLIIQFGGWLINMFIQDQAQKAAQLKAFQDAVAAHSQDAKASASEQQSDLDQQSDAAAVDAAHDAAEDAAKAQIVKKP